MKFAELIDLYRKTNQKFDDVILISQMLEDGSDPLQTRKNVEKLLKTMLEICEKSYGRSYETLTHLCGSNGFLLAEHEAQLMGEFNYVATVAALSLAESNASMGRIVACPTAGSCGVVPAIVYALRKMKKIEESVLIDSLIVAGAVGLSVASTVSISGAVAGCQAEIGTATAMASSLVVYSLSQDPEKVSHAAALSLKSLMGLVCDPVGGFVEVPCVKRNATAVNVAICVAEMVLAGIKSVIPFDEVVEAMAKVGRSMPEELRETGLGGVASTKTAQLFTKQIRGERFESTEC
ncbi:L-serine ammonia-lyase, iron-sulfur-dependent, subunit beta [Pseudothermotoga sp. U03pept]|uniref:L-serine ammonia-lyase, iron-sulfur-dependent, subunit beta n=1 Tax=Pseudothermotoga sp. U03pept TaxID=3447012 RepID=UPI003F05954F